MSLFQYLQLQPLEADEDGISTSELDAFNEDEVIDLMDENSEDGSLNQSWEKVLNDMHVNGDTIDFADDDTI